MSNDNFGNETIEVEIKAYGKLLMDYKDEFLRLSKLYNTNEIKENLINQIEFSKLNEKTNMNTIITGAPGTGKCLGKDTPIIMFNGEIKPVQEIIPGDIVMGNDSTPRFVLCINKGIDTLFKIKQKNGNEYVVNSAHILCLIYKNSFIEITVENYLKKCNEFKNNCYGYKVSADFVKKNICTDPYIFGTIVKSMPCIPANYKTNCFAVGKQVLAGLADDLAVYNKNYYKLHIVNEILANDIIFISRAQGYKTKYRNHYIKIYSHDLPTRTLIYPKSITNKQYKKDYSIIKTKILIEKIGKGEYYGFQTDKNQKFLLGDFTVTHNSTLAKILADVYNKINSNTKVIKMNNNIICKDYNYKELKNSIIIIDLVSDNIKYFCKLISEFDPYNDDFVCIITANKEHLESIMRLNENIENKFEWNYHRNNEDLHNIFMSLLPHWKVENLSDEFFIINSRYFPNYGRSIKSFMLKCKLEYIKRRFIEKQNDFILTKEDLDNGFLTYKKNMFMDDEEELQSIPPLSMYN